MIRIILKSKEVLSEAAMAERYTREELHKIFPDIKKNVENFYLTREKGVKTYEYKGNYYTVAELSKLCGKPSSWLGNKIERDGMNVEEAMFLEVPLHLNGSAWNSRGPSFEKLMSRHYDQN